MAEKEWVKEFELEETELSEEQINEVLSGKIWNVQENMTWIWVIQIK